MRIELGLDLEGAAPAPFIRSLARQRSIDLSGLFEGDSYRLDQGYVAARAAAAILTRPEDYARLTAEVLGERVFAELMLIPHTDAAAFADRVLAIREAGGNALIAMLPRLASPPDVRRMAVAAAESGLAGLNLRGDPAEHGWALDCAREAGMALILGGDAAAALEYGPARLAHATGIDRAMMDRLSEIGTVVHLSPATDIAFSGIAWRDHPAGELFHHDVRITIGNEAPAWFPADTDQRLADAFEWDDGVFAKLERNAIDAALCDDTTRDRLKEICECSTT